MSVGELKRNWCDIPKHIQSLRNVQNICKCDNKSMIHGLELTVKMSKPLFLTVDFGCLNVYWGVQFFITIMFVFC